MNAGATLRRAMLDLDRTSHDCVIIYDDIEMANWMPLPSTMPSVRTPDMANGLPALPRGE